MDMNCDCMHGLVAHDLVALEVGAAFAADGSVMVSVDNNIHFDYVNHPKANKRTRISIEHNCSYTDWR